MILSCVILTKNEEENIKRALDSVSFCREVIVIDDFSTDKTAEIAEKKGAIVKKRKLHGDFARQRNFGLAASRGEWVLFLDADEEITRELATEVYNVVKEKNNEISAYYIKRRDFWWGRELKYGEVKTMREKGLIRLVRRNSGKWAGSVHEVFLTSGPFGKLNSFLNHHPHSSLREFVRDVNYYSTLRARELLKQHTSVSIFDILAYPFFKFILNYFLKLGFLDGAAGFAYSFLMSFHSFLVRAKLYQYKHELS